MNNTLDKALLDVRKAYRLLADYQQRLIELLAFIREEFDAEHYHQYYRNALPRGFNGLEKSNNAGWRFLPLLDASVFWMRHAGQDEPYQYHRVGDLLIETQLQSDAGWDEEEQPSPDESESKLFFFFILCVEANEKPQNWIYNIWQTFTYPEAGETGHCAKFPGFIGYCDEISLLDLADEESTRAAISALRKRVCSKLGHPVWES